MNQISITLVFRDALMINSHVCTLREQHSTHPGSECFFTTAPFS